MGVIFLRNKVSGAVDVPYAIGGASPELVAAFLTAADGTTEGEYFRTSGSVDDFSMFTFSRGSYVATMFDSTGTLVWAPHNLCLYSEQFDNAAWSKNEASVAANVTTAPNGETTASKIVEAATTGIHSFRLSGTPDGVVTTLGLFIKDAGDNRYVVISRDNRSGQEAYACFNPSNGTLENSGGGDFIDAGSSSVGGGWYWCWLKVIAVTDANDAFRINLSDIALADETRSYAGDGTSGAYIWGAHTYRSDLGGMADNPDQTVSGLEKYVPTTSAAVYLSRRNAYYYNGTAWTKGGLQLESAAATQLLHGTNSFATQDETVTAQAYTLQFRGTGSIALTGAHSATLNGTGANDLVSLTFTPSAGTLTLTPSGTVDYPQLEVGSIPTSHIPNTAASGTVTRAAETLSIAAADLPYSATAMSISMKGLMTYADNDTFENFPYSWYADAQNYIRLGLLTSSTRTGQLLFQQEAANIKDESGSANAYFSPGVNIPFSVAGRHTSSSIQGAEGGAAFSADLTPTALPDLSSTDVDIGADGFNGFISEFRMWSTDIGDSGIEEVTS